MPSYRDSKRAKEELVVIVSFPSRLRLTISVAVISSSAEPIAHLGWATGLNALFLGIVIAAFHWTFELCKERGLLVRIGE